MLTAIFCEQLHHKFRQRIGKEAERKGTLTAKENDALWVDVDSTVITAFGKQEGAEKGFSYFMLACPLIPQNRIVDPRFKEKTYRTIQNYVGQTVSYQKEVIHYICPKPDHLPALMQGLITSHQLTLGGKVSPIIHAAVISYGFVYMHPFEDGNGRIHRFLIHNILSIQEMVPKGLMFPVS